MDAIVIVTALLALYLSLRICFLAQAPSQAAADQKGLGSIDKALWDSVAAMRVYHPPPMRYDSFLVVGDLHGDLHKAHEVLRLLGAEDEVR